MMDQTLQKGVVLELDGRRRLNPRVKFDWSIPFSNCSISNHHDAKLRMTETMSKPSNDPLPSFLVQTRSPELRGNNFFDDR